MTVTAVVRASLRLLGPRDRRLLALAAAIQMTTSLLDLVGVVLLGMVGSLAVSASSGQPPPAPIAKALSHLGLTGHPARPNEPDRAPIPRLGVTSLTHPPEDG